MNLIFNKKKNQFILYFLIFMGCYLLPASLLFAQAEKSITTIKTLPTLQIQNLEGDSIQIADLAKEGKITILKFWSAWTAQHCKPCEMDLEATAKLQDIWQKNGDKVHFVTISTDKGASAAQLVKAFLEAHQWDFEVLLDTDEELQTQLEITDFVPCILMVNEKGEVIYESFEAKEDYKTVLKRLLN